MVDNEPSGGNRKVPDGDNQKKTFIPPPDVDEDRDEDELETTTALQKDLRLSEKLGASSTKEFDGGDEEDELETFSTDPTEVARQENLGAEFVDVLTLAQLRSDLARVPEPDYAALGVNVRSQGGASPADVGVFRFPNQVTQTRSERGIVTDFSASTGSPPMYNGEPVKTLSYLKGGEDELLVTTGSGTVKLDSAALARFRPPVLFGFTDAAGNSTTLFANGDRTTEHPDGCKITQFGPLDQEGRLYRRDYEEAGSKRSVTYFADGRRQLSFDPPRHDGAANIVESPQQGYSRYDATFVTKPADVPQKVKERTRQLENAGASGNPKEALEAVKALAELELQSPEAKQALDKFAAQSSDNEGFVKYARFNQRGGPIHVLLEAGTMQSSQRMPLWRAAALDLSATANGGKLSFEQATLAARGLAFARHDGKAASGADEVSAQFREALMGAVESPDRQATMKAVHKMICLGDLPTVQRLQLAEEFAPIYLRGLEAALRDGAALPSFKRQFQELSQELKSDNSAAAMVMAGIAARGIDFKQNGADSKSFAELAKERVKSALPKLTEAQLAAVAPPDSGNSGGDEFVSFQAPEEPEEPEDKPKVDDKSKAEDQPKLEDKPKVADKPKVEDRPVSPAVKNFDTKLAADLKRLDDAIKQAVRDKIGDSDRIGDLQTKAVTSFDAIGNNRAKLTKKADDPQLKSKETELARAATVLEADQLRTLAVSPSRERDLRAYKACLLIASGKDAEIKDGEKQLVELIKDNPNLATDEKFHETVLKSFAEMAGMRKARGLGEWKSTLSVDDILGDKGKSDKKPEKTVGELVQKASESFFDNGIEKARPLFDEANRAAEEEYSRAERARLSLFITAIKQDATIAQDGFANKNIDEPVKERLRLTERQKEAIENSREARLQSASVKSNFAFAKIASGDEKYFVEGKKELLEILKGDPTLAMNDEFKETCTNAFKAHHLNKPEKAVAVADGAPKKEKKKEEKKEGDANQGEGPKFANKFAMPTIYNPSVTEDPTIKAYTADQITDIGLTAALIGLGIYSMMRFRNARQRAREYAQSAEEFQNIGKLEAAERGNLKGPEKTYSDVLQSYKDLAEKYKSAKAQDNAKNTEDYVKALEKAAEATRNLEESVGRGEISPEKAEHLRKFIKKEFAVTDLIPQPKPDAAKERPTVDPKVHIRGGRVGAPLSTDVARPCVFKPDKGKPDLVKGFAVEGKDGNAQVLKFSPEKAHDKGIPKDVTLKSGEHVLLHHAPGSGEAFYFERSSNQILRVDVGKDGPSPLTAEGKSAKAQVVETQPPINVPADRKSGLFPTTQQERSIELSGARGQTAGVWASRPGGGIVIGDGSRSDIVVGVGKPSSEGGRDMAHVFASQEGFFVTRTGDAPVNIRHEDGKVTELKAGETYVFKPKDALLVNKEEIKLAESTRLAHTPGSFRAVSRDGGRTTQAPFDFASNTRCDAKMTPGFSYRDTMPTADPVPTRVVDASIDPHLAAIEADVVKRFSHLKDKPEELFKELTKYVHEVGTPKQVEDGSSRVRYSQHDSMDAGSHLFNKAVGKEGSVLLGDVAARGNMVCVDQSMMLKYLSERMGLDVSVRSGTLDGQGHTWVEMKNGGKTVAGDPRNYNHLSESQRAGIEVDPATGQPKDATSLNLKPFEKVSERQGGNLLASPADFAVLTRFLNSDTVGAAMRSVEGLAGIVGSGQLEAGRAKILLLESLRNLVRTEQYRNARDKPDVSRTAADRAVLLVVDKGREALGIEPSRWQAEVEPVMSDVHSRPGDVVRAVTGVKEKPGERLFDPARAREAAQPATLRIDGKDWVRNSRGQYENRHDTRAWERIEAYREGGDTYVRSAAGETVIRADGSRVNVDNSGIRREFGVDGKIQSATTADGTRVNYEYAKDGPNKGELLTVTASDGYKLEVTGPQDYKVTQGGRTVERKGQASVDTTSGAVIERSTGSELARSRSLDGTVSEVRTGSDLSRVVEVSLNSQVDRINRVADFHMSEGRRMRFNDLMTRFTESGLPPLEKARVLEQAARLMEATGETALPQHDRVRLAEQMLFQFADIAQVSQGRNSTCTMGSMEVILSQRSPGDLAKMAADIGIKGRYVLENGAVYDATAIAGALHPDAEAARFGAPDAARVASYHDLASHETHGQEAVRGTENVGIKNRSHLSQILQVGLANVQLSSEARTVETLIAQPWVQEQIKQAGLDPNTVKLQYGRLSDTASAGERIFMVDSTGKRAILNFKNGQPIESPIVHTSDFPEIFKQVTGRYQDGLGIANANMFPSDTKGIHTETRESMRATHRVDSPESLAKVLKQTTLPVEISVWTGNPPFSQREPGWHAMVVTGYDEKSGKVTLLDPKGKDAVIEVTLEQAYKLTDAPPENRNGFFSTADMTSIAGRQSADIRLSAALRDGGFDPATRRAFAEHAELFNQGVKDVTVEKLQKELLDPFVGGSEGLRSQEAIRRMQLKVSHGSEVKLVFKTKVGGQEVAFTPLFLDTTGKTPEFVYREGGQEKRVALNQTSIEGEIPRTLIDAINSGDPVKRAEALSTVESAIAGMITQVDSVSTRQQRLAELAEQRPSRVNSSEHAEMLGELVKLDGLKARHTVEVAEAHIADARAAREQVQEPSRVDVDKKVETPTDRAVVEFEGGQLKVGDPNRPETMKPLDDTMQKRVEEHFKRAKEQAEKDYEKSKKEAEKIGPDEERNAKLKDVEQKRDDLLKKIQTDETRYRTDPDFRKLMDAKFESTAKKMVGKIGKGAITAGGVALSFFIVANYAFGHSPDIPVEADSLPPAKDLRKENRRALEDELVKTGGEKDRSSVLPPLPGQARMEDSLSAISDKLPFNASLRKELEAALKEPEKFLKGEDQKMLRAALVDALDKGLVRSPLKEELREVLKEGKITPTSLGVLRDELSRGMFDPKLIRKHLEAEKAQAPAKPKFENQAQVEDLLAADRRLLKLPFDPALRRQLEASFSEPRRLDLDHLRDKLYVATNNLQVRPEVRELLTQYLDGDIKADDLAKLQTEVKKGLFKTELIEKALEAKNKPGSDDLLRANLQHTLKGFLPVLRAGLIEDDLADIVKRAPEVAGKLPFKPALRKELSQELSKQLKELGVKDDVIKLIESSQLESAFRKMTQEDLDKLSKAKIKPPEEMIRQIKDGLSKDQFRPEYKELLEKLTKGELSAFDALSLEAAIGLRSKSSGLYKPDLVKSMLDKEMETKTWGPVSQAAYANMVRYAEADANVHYRFLGKEQLRYLPSDGPIKIPPGMSFEQFQQELASGQRRVKLDLNLDNPPTRKDMEKIYATLNWNSEAKKVKEAGFKERDYRELEGLLKRMNRAEWIPGEKIHGDSLAWERRMREVAPIASTFSQVDGTEKAIKKMIEMRREKPGWYAQLFNDTSTKTTWMDEAIKDLQKLQDDRGMALPKDLYETQDKRDRMVALQKWLDKYQDKAKDQYLKIMDNVEQNRFVIYGDRPKIAGFDPDKGPNGQDYNLVRDNFWAKKLPGNKWEVRTETEYAQSEVYSVYDCPLLCGSAGKVVNHGNKDPMICEDGELLPVFEPGAGKLFLVEVQNLGSYKFSEASSYYAALVAEVGVDAAMTYTGVKGLQQAGKLAVKAGQLATKEASKQLMKQAVKSALAGVMEFTLGASGPWLHTAKARYESDVGKWLNKRRGEAFVVMAGYSLISFGKNSVAWAGRQTGMLSAAPKATEMLVGQAKAWKDLSAMGKAGRVLETSQSLGTQAYFLGLSGREFINIAGFKQGIFGDGKGDSLENTRTNFIGRKARERISAIENRTGSEIFADEKGGSKQSDYGKHFLLSEGKTLSSGKPKETADAIIKTMTDAAAVLRLDPKDKGREATVTKLGDTYRTAKTPEEKQAAAIALLDLSRKAGVIDHNASIAGHRTADLLDFLTKEQAEGSPERRIAAAKARFAFAEIPGQDYAGVCETLLKDKGASTDVKMQAIAGLGMSMWAAQDAEKSFESAAEFMDYWSRSHGRSQVELQEKLTAIANGSSGEESADLRAFAGNVLFALNRHDTSDRAFLLDSAFRDWAAGRAKGDGEYAKAFVAEMRKDLVFTPPNNPIQYADARSHQLMAATVLATIKNPGLSPSEWNTAQDEVNNALADCVSFRAPDVAVQALARLGGDRLKSLPRDVQDRVRINAVNILRMENSSDPNLGNPLQCKLTLLEMLPNILAHANPSQRQHAVASVTSLIKQGDKNYAGSSPEMRIAAIHALASMGDRGGEQVLRDLLVFKDGEPLEPSADVRIAALQNLHRMILPENRDNNEKFKAYLKEYKAKESDPRANQIAEALSIVREIRPIPQDGDKETERREVRYYDEFGTPDRMHMSINRFLDQNFAKLNKQDYDKKIADNTKSYDSSFGLLSYASDTWSWQYKHGHWAPGQGKGAVEYNRDEREKVAYEYASDLYRLARWSKGEFKNDKLPANEKNIKDEDHRLDVQKQAIRTLAYLIRHSGNADPGEHANGPGVMYPDVGEIPMIDYKGKNFLRDLDRNECTAVAAKALADLCKPGQGDGVRVQASKYLIELIKNPDISPQARLQLARGLNHLYDFSAEKLKSTDHSQAIISKEEAALITADALKAHRAGRLPEDEGEPGDSEEKKRWQRDVEASRKVQDELMLGLVWTHENRQVKRVIEDIIHKTKDDNLKRRAELMLDRTMGVAVRDREYSRGERALESGKSPADRARQVQDSLDAVRNGASAYEAVEHIFRASYGRGFDEKDERLPVLTAALNHNDELIRCAAAFALTSAHARKTIPGALQGQALKTLADLSKHSTNPHVKSEANIKLKELTLETNRAFYQSKNKSEKPASTKEERDRTDSLKRRVDFFEKLDSEAAKDRQGVKSIFYECATGAQNASIPQRTAELKNLVEGKSTGDPVRAIFRACLSRADDPELKDQGLLNARESDERIPLLRQLAESTDERTRVAANMMLARFAPSVTDRVASFNALANTEGYSTSDVLRLDAGKELDGLTTVFAQQRFGNLNFDGKVKAARENVVKSKALEAELSKPPAEVKADALKKQIKELCGFQNPILTPDDPRMRVVLRATEYGDTENPEHKEIRRIAVQAVLESHAGRFRETKQFIEMNSMLETSYKLTQEKYPGAQPDKVPEVNEKLSLMRDGHTVAGQFYLQNEQPLFAKHEFQKALEFENRRTPRDKQGKFESTAQAKMLISTIDNLKTASSDQEDFERDRKRKASDEYSRNSEVRIADVLTAYPQLKDIAEAGTTTDAAVESLDARTSELVKDGKYSEARDLLVAYNKLLEASDTTGGANHAKIVGIYSSAIYNLGGKGQATVTLDIKDESIRLAIREDELRMRYGSSGDSAISAQRDIARDVLHSFRSTSTKADPEELKRLSGRLALLEKQVDQMSNGDPIDLAPRLSGPVVDVQAKIRAGLPLSLDQTITAYGEAVKKGDAAGVAQALDMLTAPGMPALRSGDRRLKLLQDASKFGDDSKLTPADREVRRKAELQLTRFRAQEALTTRNFSQALKEAESAVKLAGGDTAKEVTPELMTQYRLLTRVLDAQMKVNFFESTDYTAAETQAKRILDIERTLSGGETNTGVKRAFATLTNLRSRQVQESYDEQDWPKAEGIRAEIRERHIKDVNNVFKKELDAREERARDEYKSASKKELGTYQEQQRDLRSFFDLLDVLVYRGKFDDARKLASDRAEAVSKRGGLDFAGRPPIEMAVWDLKIAAQMLSERNQHQVKGMVLVEVAKFMEKEAELEEKVHDEKYGKDSYKGIVDILHLPFLREYMNDIGADEKKAIEASIERLEKKYLLGKHAVKSK